MKVCKCDRCGALFNPTPKDLDWYSRVISVGQETFGLTDIVGEVDESFDICDDCYKSFRKWMKRGAFKGESK